jgi:exopolysaccharide biosynthesis glucuronosyltransferase PssE
VILVTVGTELPFDRLVKAVDHWAAMRGRSDVFAQIGDGAWEPAHFPFRDFMEPTEFSEHLRSADLIVAHAGMGTILSALHYGKPLLVMPRRADLGEQRNDHQLATAERLLEMGKINVAFDEQELLHKLDRLDKLAAGTRIGPAAGGELLAALRQFIG